MVGRRFVLGLEEVGKADVPLVGGKGASLGELIRARIPVPPGFVVTTQAYQTFLEKPGLSSFIRGLLESLDPNDSQNLEEVSRQIKEAIMQSPMPPDVAREIRDAYALLKDGHVAVRSSATAEDLAEASFAGQQRTYLNVEGEEQVLKAVHGCWASLFEPRAIFYRCEQGFSHLDVSIAVPVQRMVQSQTSGVMFTVEPLTSDPTKIAIEAIFGLGEAIVSGEVTPDLYIVDKDTMAIADKKVARQEWRLERNPDAAGDPEDANIKADVPPSQEWQQKLTDEEIIALVRIGKTIENYYGFPQDIEWAREGGKFYIVQSRPITTLGKVPVELQKVVAVVLLSGSGASPGMAAGSVRIVRNVRELGKVAKGDILVTEMTTPDFVPAMKRSVAIVTDRGGRTCHAAIVSRELGLPCVVGTSNATAVLQDTQEITVDGAQGHVYEGRIEIKTRDLKIKKWKTRTKVLVNLADPELADVVATKGVDGVGLLRAEFIIAHMGQHPRHMLESGRAEEWIRGLTSGIEKFAHAFHPRQVVYRTTDFKTNEYRNLEGGELYEQGEENPMIGYRGCSRYVADIETFRMEMEAFKRVRRQYENLYLMLPFVRTPNELSQVKAALESEGLSREKGLKLWMMVEVPSNVIQIDKFIDQGIDGISIGSNDLTQLILGVDRDNSRLAEVFNERDPAVMWGLERAVTEATRRGITSSICGQAPSFYPDLTEKLVEWGITSISVSPDMIDRTREVVARVEKKLGKLPAQS